MDASVKQNTRGKKQIKKKMMSSILDSLSLKFMASPAESYVYESAAQQKDPSWRYKLFFKIGFIAG